MLRFVTFVVLILNCSAKLFISKTFDEENGVHSENNKSVRFEFVNRGAPLWILTLSGDEWMAPKFKLANTTELEEFFLYIEPSLRK